MPGSAACAGGQEVFGSGFFLRIPDFNAGSCGDAGRIVIITNAHVVGDSKDLKFEMPDLTGRAAYDVAAISVNVEWDIAVLDISDSTRDDITSALDARTDVTGFPALELALDSDQDLAGGSFSNINEAVVSIGYPLAQDTVVASDGSRSGGEIVFGNYVYEFDAQISPGSSGGCVVRKSDGKVIGISFASVNSPEAESLNFAIPAFRVAIQLSSVFCGAVASPTISTCDGGQALDCEFNVAQINTLYEEGTTKLYNTHGCSSGIFVNQVPEQSIYRSTTPPLPAYEKIFITGLRPGTWDAQVDSFGFVTAPSIFTSTPVPLNDAIFFLDPRVGEDITTPVSIEVCVPGHGTNQYQLNLADDVRYELPIENLKQPSLQIFYYGNDPASKIQAERFGPIVVRQAGVALAAECAAHGHLYKHADILQAAEEEFLYNEEPALIVVQAPASANPQADGYVRSMSKCDQVKFLNGALVKTMRDFADHYQPQNGGDTWTLETHEGLEFEAPYVATLTEMLEELQSGLILTPIAQAKAQDAGLDVDQYIQDATNAQTQVNPGFVQQSDKSAETNATTPLFVEASGLDVTHTTIKKQRPKIPAAVSLLNMVEAAAQMALLGTSEKDELLRTQLHHFTLQQSKRGHSQFWHNYRKKRGVQGAQRRSFATDV